MVATIGEKIVEISLFGEQNIPHPSPLLFIQIWGVCQFPRSSSKSVKILRGGVGEDKLYFPFL